MRALGAAAAFAAWMLVPCLGAGAAEPTSTAIAVIVGEKSFVGTVSLDDLRELYLRRRRLWPNGRPAVPVNLPPDAPAREQFSRIVLGRSPQDLVSYWNARYFEGLVPPTVLQSPSAVRAYLAVEPAAIGYIPLSEVDDTCRTLLILGR